MRPFHCLSLALPFALLAGAAMGAEQLWTVQAVNAAGAVVCDAFAKGAAAGAGDRVPYEIRFRRSNDALLLIVSHEGPALPRVRDLTIRLDGRPVGTFPAQALTFDTRPAIATSLDPRSVDFQDLQRHRLLTVTVGSARFEMAFLSTDKLAEGMEACARFAKQPG